MGRVTLCKNGLIRLGSRNHGLVVNQNVSHVRFPFSNQSKFLLKGQQHATFQAMFVFMDDEDHLPIGGLHAYYKNTNPITAGNKVYFNTTFVSISTESEFLSLHIDL